MASPSSGTLRIGVLALQGSFREHMTLLQRIDGIEVIEVRTKEELESVSGLVIPGGESTTMALVAERWGLIPELRGFAQAGKPIWGTCAGMIFLADRADGKPTRDCPPVHSSLHMPHEQLYIYLCLSFSLVQRAGAFG
jgi:glutamine amidotransferase PdxT